MAQRLRLPPIAERLEERLELERDQLFLWSPVALGLGVAAWFVLDTRSAWLAWLGLASAAVAGGWAAPRGSRLRQLLMVGGVLAALGCALAWARAERVAGPVVGRIAVVAFEGRIADIDKLSARGVVRLVLEPRPPAALPPKLRVTVDEKDAPPDLREGDVVRLRARLLPPQGPAVPGGYDFARAAWFMELGAVGKALGPVALVQGVPRGEDGLRTRLSDHVRAQLPGSAGGIAAAFATGERGGITVEDEEAMRASGLTHLLSISGLHITAVVAGVMWLALRLLALSPWLALRAPLVAVAAGCGAAAGVGYTLLTGAEIPTIRSCVAAVLVVIGIAVGREALTLRLVAAGAVLVLLVWPESLVGPSFQLSFAAIAAIVALHEQPQVREWFMGRDEGWGMKLLRGLGSLLLTGIVVELALAPIALFHFHKAGVYGALANIIAIPLTTFVIMPLEALALLFDLIGLGWPFWQLTGLSLNFLLWLAHTVAKFPLAQAALADVPVGAFGAIVLGGLWVILWRSNWRWLGLLPFFGGSVAALSAPAPDLVITGDGKHLAVRGDDGTLATLRPRAGDYVRSVLGERAGSLGELADLDDLRDAWCSNDLCRVELTRNGRQWRVLATRSPYFVSRPVFERECARADLVVSDRRLPTWCRPRWFRADATLLRQTGGLAVTFSSGKVDTANEGRTDHPWRRQ